jgi:hypothetical protein
MMTATTFAQKTERNYELAPYGFVGVQGGVQKTWSNPGVRDWKPMFGLQGGYFFTEVFGARLQGTYSKWDVDLDNNTTYNSSRLGIDMDLLFNFSNLFFPHRNADHVLFLAHFLRYAFRPGFTLVHGKLLPLPLSA